MCRQLIFCTAFYLINGVFIWSASAQNRPLFLTFRRSQPSSDRQNGFNLKFIGDRLPPPFSGAQIFDTLENLIVISSEKPAIFQHDNSLSYKRGDERTKCLSSSKVKCDSQDTNTKHNLMKQDVLKKPLHNTVTTPVTTTTTEITTTELLTDSTTELTGEYETTTMEYDDLNRIANPSHVVASLIG